MGLIARVIETQGIPTVCVVMNRDIAQNVLLPRALHVRFPYGAPLGPGGNAPVQEAVIVEALNVLVEAQAPGALVESTTEWPE